ncbi:MAG: nucleotide exchange factor GrpE [Candidatus Omnitrophica bacterium]|nr:nucleotide exchange factor GrpE [Candidatus Omnitrophota bacterium]
MKNEKIYFVKERDLINLRESAKKVKELEKEKNRMKDKLISILADFENYRKRVEKEKKDLMKYGNELLILQLIPFYEIFEGVLKQLEKTASVEDIKKGLELLRKEFGKLLEKFGVKKIDAKGKKFDPSIHEATGIIETDEYEDGIVIEEEKAGYIYNDRVIKPSLVKVSKKKEKNNAEDKSTCES